LPGPLSEDQYRNVIAVTPKKALKEAGISGG